MLVHPSHELTDSSVAVCWASAFLPYRTDLRYRCFIVLAGTGTKAAVYEKGSHKGTFGAFGPDTELEIRITADSKIQYADDGHVFYTSAEKSISFPLHVGAVLHTVQDIGFSRVRYLDSLPDAPPAATSPPPSPPNMISPPPPLPPGDYVVFNGGSNPDLVTSPGAVSRVLGPAGWDAAAWSNEDIWGSDGLRKGIGFRCPLSEGAKMIGFVRGAFKETSSYSGLEFSLYCAHAKLPSTAYVVD